MHKVNHHIELCSKIIVLCLLSIVLTTGIMLSSNITKAESSSANAAVTVPEACTMTSTNNTPHTAVLSPNTYSGASGSDYENGIGKTTLSVVCNDYNGFSIYAIGFTGNQYEGENHTKLVGSNTGNTISTAVYTNNTTPSNWSMKLTKITDSAESYNPANLTISTGYDAYHAVPDTYTKVAQYKANTGSSTTDTTLGVKLETTYAAFIASNQPADTYVGQVKYTMVHPYNEVPAQSQACASGYICYYANTVTAEGTMGNQTVNTSDTSITLLASNFSRQGYGFAGWSDVFDYTTNTSAHFYGPNEDITFTAGEYTGTNPGLSLYAIWIKSEGSLQDPSKVTELCGTSPSTGTLITAPIDGTANLSSVSALTDQRDNETYAIARLADGNCWMVENLRLESTAAHNSDGSLAQGYGASTTYGNFSGLANAENSGFSSTYTANSLYYSGTQEGTASIDIGTTNYPQYRIPRYNNTNTSARATNPTTNLSVIYSYGNYYTWHAAIADTTYYSSGDHNNTSICPSGWRLPTGTNPGTNPPNTWQGDYWNLAATLGGGIASDNSNQSDLVGPNGSIRLRRYPNNFIYSGGGSGELEDSIRGIYGNYWSATAVEDNITKAYILSIGNNYIGPGYGFDPKNNGWPIRCIIH